MSKMKEYAIDESNDLQITVEDAINDIESEEEECEYCTDEKLCSECLDRYLDEQADRDLEYQREVEAGIWD